MKKLVTIAVAIFTTITITAFFSCSGGGSGERLQVEEVDPANPGDGGNDGGSDGTTPGTGQTLPETSSDGYHPLFSLALGESIPYYDLSAVANDKTGKNIVIDYDGDGIPNDQEIITNQFVADYPRIVTRISAPITMEIRVSETSTKENHTETVEDSDMRDTITNSMEDRQYAQVNNKTTPYVSKESYANSDSHSEAYGFENEFSASGSTDTFLGGMSMTVSGKHAENSSVSDSFSRSAMAEKTVFSDVNYIDNLDRNGKEFTNETVQKIVRNYRQNTSLKTNESIGPDAGIVRASLFIKNTSIDMPVRVSNIVCTLSFRTPAGQFLPIKSFRLRNEDWSVFEQDIYGGDEFGPYTVEVNGLNTHEVKQALANGYVPQIHVVSYDLRRVMDSNYNPGVDNLKIVEETAKSRTATIVIVGKNKREIFRVCAFDVDEYGNYTPGVSLKKALYNIYRSRTGNGEQWDMDREGNPLTVKDSGLKWKAGADDPESYVFTENTAGNTWTGFETYVKSYRDEYDQVHRFETIKRIGELKKYNPFSTEDNPAYNPNDLLSQSEINKMKYWVIYHDGRYYLGDINDPIWAGERYEIICFDAEDFNKHLQNFQYTPLQSMEPVYLDTRWNKLTNSGEYARARYFGRVIKGDVVHLEIDLMESDFLFDPDVVSTAVGNPQALTDYTANAWYAFNYTFQPPVELEQGIPKEFDHEATGGANNIKVSIAESQLAHYYEISFKEEGNGAALKKTMKVTRDELKAGGGFVYITRNSPDTAGNPVGRIDGGVYYNVNVRAFGKAYGVTVGTNSTTNGYVRTYVNDVQGGISPGAFSFSTVGYRNGVNVRIAESGSAEYFRVKVIGPLNYTAEERSFIAHAGSNNFTIPNPVEGINANGDPGVFAVQAFAVNENCLSGPVEDEMLIVAANNQDQNVFIDFEKYAAQKIYRPRKSTSLFDLRAIDLEVNFNDGSGWYNIRLSSFDNQGKNIDCRYTSYYEKDKQKFHVFFQPPAGENTIYNVFMGGREEVDLYVRTQAKVEYRDSLWLKPNDDMEYDPFDNQVLTNIGMGDFLNFWINHEQTDATSIEDTVGNLGFENTNVNEGEIALVDNGIADYFFAPLQRRIYRIKASFNDTINTFDTIRPDYPEYTAVEGDRSIFVSNISFQYADSWEVRWKEANPNTTWNIFEYPWNTSDKITSKEYIISSLNPNTNYIIAVIGANAKGYGSPRFYNDNTDDNIIDVDKVKYIMPYTTIPPAAPQGVALNLGADGRSIIVSNINVPGQYKYEVNWRAQSDGTWSAAAIGSDASPNFNPQSYTISSLNYWDRYLVRARAVTGSGVAGPWNSQMLINTQTPSEDSITCSAGWFNIIYKRGSMAAWYSDLPLSTKQVQIQYSIQYENYHQIPQFSTPLIYDNTKNSNSTSSWLSPGSNYVILNDVPIHTEERVYDPNGDYDIQRYHYLNVTLSVTIKAKNTYDEIIEKSFTFNIPNWK